MKIISIHARTSLRLLNRAVCSKHGTAPPCGRSDLKHLQPTTRPRENVHAHRSRGVLRGEGGERQASNPGRRMSLNGNERHTCASFKTHRLPQTPQHLCRLTPMQVHCVSEASDRIRRQSKKEKEGLRTSG